jgi:two-component system, chemotaxis family, chemotaxis protein CheY
MAKILIVDDSRSVRQQLRTILEDDAHIVVEATDGKEGLRMARHLDVSLIITDVNMPHMSGIEMIREIRKTSLHENTPIFVLTTEGTPAVARAGREAGANAWVVKPFDTPKLLGAVHAVLARHTARA